MSDNITCPCKITRDTKKKNTIFTLKQLCIIKFLESNLDKLGTWLDIPEYLIKELPIELKEELNNYVIFNYLEEKYGLSWESNTNQSFYNYHELIKIKILRNYDFFNGKLWFFIWYMYELNIPEIEDHNESTLNGLSWNVKIDSKDILEKINQVFINYDTKYYISPEFRGNINFKIKFN